MTDTARAERPRAYSHLDVSPCAAAAAILTPPAPPRAPAASPPRRSSDLGDDQIGLCADRARGARSEPLGLGLGLVAAHRLQAAGEDDEPRRGQDRKSTRLNSSHLVISYAVFCLKKKKHDRHSARGETPRLLSPRRQSLRCCRRHSHPPRPPPRAGRFPSTTLFRSRRRSDRSLR